jgi:cell division protein FtsQ
MDGGGRLAGSLSQTAPRPGKAPAAEVPSWTYSRKQHQSHVWLPETSGQWRRFGRTLNRTANRLSWLPRRAGVVVTLLLIVGSAVYGAAWSGQAGRVINFFKDVRDGLATRAGFPIATVAITGEKHLSREEILAGAGVTPRASLLFFDVADARARLLTNPWVAEATVQKLLPDRLVISISERAAFALWQKAGRVGVIADDGTVLEPAVLAQYANLPLVVGTGADTRAREFLALLDRRPDLRANVRASILIAERRWNLRLKNGVDVRLPELDVERALDRLVALERDVRLSDRDITAIDLRQADRITVRLSDEAFEVREEAAKKKQQKPKGGSA